MSLNGFPFFFLFVFSTQVSNRVWKPLGKLKLNFLVESLDRSDSSYSLPYHSPRSSTYRKIFYEEPTNYLLFVARPVGSRWICPIPSNGASSRTSHVYPIQD